MARQTDQQFLLEYFEKTQKKVLHPTIEKKKSQKRKVIIKQESINHDYDDLLADKILGCLGG